MMCIEKQKSIKDLFDHAHGSFFIADKYGQIVYANTAMTYRTGFSLAEMVGRKPGNLWGGLMKKSYYKDLWNTVEIKQEPFINTISNKKKSGNMYTDIMHILPIKNHKGSIQYYLEVHPDTYQEGKKYEFTDKLLNFWDTHTNNELLPWILNNISNNESDYSLMQENIQDVIYNEFIIPIEELFENRFNDRKLLIHAQKDSSNFLHIYLKYYEMILFFFLKRLDYNQSLSEDLTQDVFIKAFEYLASFKFAHSSYATYLKRIAHTTLIDYFRKKKDIIFEDIENVQIIEQNHNTTLDFEMFWEKITILSSFEQEILKMKYQEGYKIKEIAEKYDKSENAIKSQLKRIRIKLLKRFR